MGERLWLWLTFFKQGLDGIRNGLDNGPEATENKDEEDEDEQPNNDGPTEAPRSKQNWKNNRKYI